MQFDEVGSITKNYAKFGRKWQETYVFFQKKVDEWQIYTLMVYSVVFFVCSGDFFSPSSMEGGMKNPGGEM